MTTCPVADCGTDDLIDGDDLLDHFYDEHDYEVLANTVIVLARALDTARANTECQICGNYGAEPGEHPLCESCEKEVHG